MPVCVRRTRKSFSRKLLMLISFRYLHMHACIRVMDTLVLRFTLCVCLYVSAWHAHMQICQMPKAMRWVRRILRQIYHCIWVWCMVDIYAIVHVLVYMWQWHVDKVLQNTIDCMYTSIFQRRFFSFRVTIWFHEFTCDKGLDPVAHVPLTICQL